MRKWTQSRFGSNTAHWVPTRWDSFRTMKCFCPGESFPRRTSPLPRGGAACLSSSPRIAGRWRRVPGTKNALRRSRPSRAQEPVGEIQGTHSHGIRLADIITDRTFEFSEDSLPSPVRVLREEEEIRRR